jgi:hypothetical protein
LGIKSIARSKNKASTTLIVIERYPAPDIAYRVTDEFSSQLSVIRNVD